MNGGTQALLATFALLAFLVLVWMMVPTEQTLMARFPNVVIARGFGSEDIDPISFDNTTLPALSKSQASYLNGLYQYDPLFYHKSFDRFIAWEDRYKATIFECTLFCGAMNRTGPDTRLALVHYSPDEKKHLWYLIEMHDDDANSPYIYARSKFRKSETYRSPWMTVTPGGDIKPHDLKDVYLTTAWDLFAFDTPLKWGVTAAIVIGIAVLWKVRKDKDD